MSLFFQIVIQCDGCGLKRETIDGGFVPSFEKRRHEWVLRRLLGWKTVPAEKGMLPELLHHYCPDCKDKAP